MCVIKVKVNCFQYCGWAVLLLECVVFGFVMVVDENEGVTLGLHEKLVQ